MSELCQPSALLAARSAARLWSSSPDLRRARDAVIWFHIHDVQICESSGAPIAYTVYTWSSCLTTGGAHCTKQHVLAVLAFVADLRFHVGPRGAERILDDTRNLSECTPIGVPGWNASHWWWDGTQALRTH